MDHLNLSHTARVLTLTASWLLVICVVAAATDKVGAQASANLFSLVMTARANEVEPFEYLSYVFEHQPSTATVEALLPWNLKAILNARKRDL